MLQIQICMTSWFTLAMPSTLFVFLLLKSSACIHCTQVTAGHHRRQLSSLWASDFLSHNSPFIRVRLRWPLSSSAIICQLHLPLILYSYTSSASAVLCQPHLLFLSVSYTPSASTAFHYLQQDFLSWSGWINTGSSICVQITWLSNGLKRLGWADRWVNKTLVFDFASKPYETVALSNSEIIFNCDLLGFRKAQTMI